MKRRGAHKRAKGGRKPLSDDLPRVRIEHDIAETEKLCPCGSGHARPKIGEMIAEQADIVPARVQVLQHVRFKYGPCHVCDGVFPETAAGAEVDADDARPVIAAPMRPQPLPRSIASPRTCTFVTTAKYADGLPLYRLEKILKRYGLDVSRGTLAQWMIRLGDLIVPLMNLMEEVLLGARLCRRRTFAESEPRCASHLGEVQALMSALSTSRRTSSIRLRGRAFDRCPRRATGRMDDG